MLQNESKLSDYKIENGHTVHMVARPVNYQELQQRANVVPTSAPISTSSTRDSLQSLLALSALIDPMRYRAESAPRPSLNPSLEPIRQSLLTMHSLSSTIPLVNLQHDEHADFCEESKVDYKSYLISDVKFTNERVQYYVGQWIDVKDTINQWLEATVMDIKESERKIFIHYNGW